MTAPGPHRPGFTVPLSEFISSQSVILGVNVIAHHITLPLPAQPSIPCRGGPDRESRKRQSSPAPPMNLMRGVPMLRQYIPYPSTVPSHPIPQPSPTGMCREPPKVDVPAYLRRAEVKSAERTYANQPASQLPRQPGKQTN